MAASFPTSVKSFTTKVDGAAGDLVAAVDVNGLQDEVVAIETELKKTTGSVVDHGGLAGLADNDHPQYSLTTHDHDADYLGITAVAADSLLLNGANASATPTPSTVPIADAAGKLAVGWLPDTNVDGWTPVSDTWTYASASTITVPAGAAALYSVGDKIKLTQGGTVKYFYIVKVENALLTVAGQYAVVIINSAITSIYYSHQESPVGFPGLFTFVPTITYTGGSTDPTGVTIVGSPTYSISGHKVHAFIELTTGSGGGNRTSMYLSTSAITASIAMGGTSMALIWSTPTGGIPVITEIPTLASGSSGIRLYLGGTPLPNTIDGLDYIRVDISFWI